MVIKNEIIIKNYFLLRFNIILHVIKCLIIPIYCKIICTLKIILCFCFFQADVLLMSCIFTFFVLTEWENSQ